MSQLYARVFLKVLDSSIAEDFTLRHVFEDMLKLANDGAVDMTREALSRRLNIPLDLLNSCIAKLEAPDPQSRNPADDGRRLRRLDDHRDWGWAIVNWQEYESIRSKEDERARTKERVKRHREQQQAKAGPPPPPTPLPKGDPDSYSDSDSEGALQNVTDRYRPLQGSQKPATEADATLPSVAWAREQGPEPLQLRKGLTPPQFPPVDEKRPSGVPATEAEAIAWAGMECVPAEFATEVFSKCEGVGWIDGAKRPITNFRAYIKHRWVTRQGQVAEGKATTGGRPLSVSDLREAIKVKEQRAAEIKTRGSSDVAMGTTWTDPKAKEQYFALRKEIRALQMRIENLCT